MIALQGLMKACFNIGANEDAIKHFNSLSKLSNDLTELENDLIDFPFTDVSFNLGVKLRESK